MRLGIDNKSKMKSRSKSKIRSRSKSKIRSRSKSKNLDSEYACEKVRKIRMSRALFIQRNKYAERRRPLA